MNDPILICGGAGFIGSNVASHYLSLGRRVILYDDLSRHGVERNLEWLRAEYGGLLDFELADIRDRSQLRKAVRSASAVFHFAAQTAVTTSLRSPVEDFEVNAAGALTLLEELRNRPAPVPLLFTSTNKVYGNLDKLALRLSGDRYYPQHPGIYSNGVSETWPLSFHSPYGCSKGSADQYVLDYARSYGLPNIVFRMSCIYGPHQFGTEDQGWVAHFLISAMHGQPIVIYGDGCQVRDVLYVDDLVAAMSTAMEQVDRIAGQAFNIGGGPRHTISLLELLKEIRQLEGSQPDVRFEDWRIGDQRYYVSDIRSFWRATGWAPSTTPAEGIRKLHEWLRSESERTRVAALASAGAERGAR